MTKQNTIDAIKFWFDCNAGFERLPDNTPINQTDLGMELTIGDMRELLNAWQPIETAPKDGSEILLCDELYNVCRGRFGKIDGWEGVIKNNLFKSTFCFNPTHWQPLPPLP